MQQFIILITILVSIVSCRDEDHLALKPVKADSSFSKSGHDIAEILPSITNKLNLTSITNGVDSFEFRFWLPEEKLDTISVLSIKNVRSKWESKISKFVAIIPDYEFKRGDTTNYLRLATIKLISTSNISPNININLIIDTLAMLDLQNSPSNAKIEEGQEFASGDIRYTLEFADKNNYRALYYSTGSRNVGLAEFDKTFEQFLHFIKRHYKANFY